MLTGGLDGAIQPLLAQYFTKAVYESLLASKVPNVHENTVTLLKNIKEHLPDEQVEPFQDALRENGVIEDSKLELDLLKKLNLDGTISQKDILLIKKIGEGQYGDVWQVRGPSVRLREYSFSTRQSTTAFQWRARF